MKRFSVVLIDDEKNAVENLQYLIKELCPELDIVYSSTNPLDTAKWWNKNEAPDFLFIDIEMPGLTGFDLLELIDVKETKVIFVTAYDHYAIKAIDFQPFAYMEVFDVSGYDPQKFFCLRYKVSNDALIDLFIEKEFSHS